MKMAKASDADLKMAMELTSAFESLMDYRTMPSDAQSDDPEEFDIESPADCYRALRDLFGIAEKGSLMRVVWGMAVLLDPMNEIVDPNSHVLDVHPKYSATHDLLSALTKAADQLEVDALYVQANGGSGIRQNETAAAARAAIAKAEGGAN